MMRILLLLTILCSWQVSALAHRSLMILGDSLSTAYGLPVEQGWVQLLRQRINEQGYCHEVHNASISGDTLKNGLRRLPKALLQYQPDLVLIELGGNDGLRGFSPKQIRSDLNAIITLIKDAGADVVLAGIQLPPSYGQTYTKAFYQIYTDAAKDDQVTLIPFFMKDVGGVEGMIQGDGIHPTADAQSVLLNNAWEVLESLLVKCRTQ